MKRQFGNIVSVALFLVMMGTGAVVEARAKGATPSFDSVWFYRDGTRVVPEISKNWLTVVLDSTLVAAAVTGDAATEVDAQAADSQIRNKARALLKANHRLADYFYDPNLAKDACFFKLRGAPKPAEVAALIGKLRQVKGVRYAHPALVISNKTYAYFNQFELEWKTGTEKNQREALLGAAHAVMDETDEKGKRYVVNVKAIPFFKAVNLLAEDVRVLRVTPHLVEVKPSISARLSLLMNGGNIGDGVPFSLTINFSDRVTIDPSSISTLNLRPPDLQKELFDCVLDSYDYAKAATKSPIVITGRLAFYAPGEYTIPPVKIGYSCPTCADKSVRTIESEPAPFQVSSIIPDTHSQFRLIVPTEPVAATGRLDTLERRSRLFFWLMLLAAAGVAACVGWALLLRRADGDHLNHLEERRREAQLAELLRARLQEAPTAPHWRWLAETGALLREYLTLHYGVESRFRGGSGRQFMETMGDRIPPESREALASVLATVDICVIREEDEIEELERLRAHMLDMVAPNGRNGSGRG